MNIGKKLSAFGFAVLFLSMVSCKRDTIEPASQVGIDSLATTGFSSINSWIYEVMQDAYFWSKEMPAQGTLDARANPADYFEKLIYKRTTVDRFSGITDDIQSLQKEFNGISKIFGIF